MLLSFFPFFHLCFCCRGAELFQATIVKAVKARIEEEKKSMDQLKRQYVFIYTHACTFCIHFSWTLGIFLALYFIETLVKFLTNVVVVFATTEMVLYALGGLRYFSITQF